MRLSIINMFFFLLGCWDVVVVLRPLRTGHPLLVVPGAWAAIRLTVAMVTADIDVWRFTSHDRTRTRGLFAALGGHAGDKRGGHHNRRSVVCHDRLTILEVAGFDVPGVIAVR